MWAKRDGTGVAFGPSAAFLLPNGAMRSPDAAWVLRSRLGWLIDAQERRIHVYRPPHPVEDLENPSRIAGDPELPGFALDLTPIWQGW